MLEALDFITFATVWKLPFEKYKHNVVTPRQILAIDDQNELVSFELKSAQKKNSLSLKQLLSQNKDNPDDVKILSLAPLKKKLMAIVEQRFESKAVYLR